ncbi:nucleotide disphospho-sugar-binding domain-containing protein [Catenuloplanes japonicus]|uniref:nucleotide disphospho-sugar-binding domain-containing protein n=1 Tax=Catenuloplanes japonicus TaxID=33876 RepID=UPI000AC021C7|nr:nucleotide disphospho-sugar-binding domain-containing protein [Catenuloplanes japonicus]
MRILFTVSNWAGHYMCMVPLAWAFRAAGHDVRVACPPQQVQGVISTGLMPVSVLDAADMMESARLAYWSLAINTPPQSGEMPLPLHPFTGEALSSVRDFDTGTLSDFWKKTITAVQRSFDNAVDFAASWRPDLVVHDIMAIEGALVGVLNNVPSVYYGPGFIGTVETEPGLNLMAGDPLSCFEKYGVDWTRRDIRYAVDPSPDAAVPPMGDALRIPVRYHPYNGNQDVDPWLLGPIRGKRVCVVWGNSATGVFGERLPALRRAVETAAQLATEVVLTAALSEVDAMGSLPQNVRVLRNCPLELILPDCDLLIHHGSANCLMNGIVTGVPQLSLALNYDGQIYGRRLDPQGATKTLPGLMISAEEIDKAIAEMLFDHRYRRRAAELRASVAGAPTAAQVADLLVTLARTGELTPGDVAGLVAGPDQHRREITGDTVSEVR